jgi:hypothetical protein
MQDRALFAWAASKRTAESVNNEAPTVVLDGGNRGKVQLRVVSHAYVDGGSEEAATSPIGPVLLWNGPGHCYLNPRGLQDLVDFVYRWFEIAPSDLRKVQKAVDAGA